MNSFKYIMGELCALLRGQCVDNPLLAPGKSRNKFPGFAFVNRISGFSLMLSFLLLIPVAHAATDMSAPQVLASGCNAAPRNMALSDFWEGKMGILESWCDYPAITQSSISGARKPQAFLHGSAAVPHDQLIESILAGLGNNGNELGYAPATTTTFSLYCSDASDLMEASPGDVVFSMRAWSSSCRITNEVYPTIPIFGGLDGNNDTFVGNQKAAHGIHNSSGGNYGLSVDYFTPGGANTVLGGGNVSYALPELAGIIVALNSVLISEGKVPLDNDTIKPVLDASSDEVYLEVNGTRGIYKENQVQALLQNPTTKYYGQIIDLPNAIEFALTGNIAVPPPPPPPPPPPLTPGQVAARMIPILMLLNE